MIGVNILKRFSTGYLKMNWAWLLALFFGFDMAPVLAYWPGWRGYR